MLHTEHTSCVYCRCSLKRNEGYIDAGRVQNSGGSRYYTSYNRSESFPPEFTVRSLSLGNKMHATSHSSRFPRFQGKKIFFFLLDLATRHLLFQVKWYNASSSSAYRIQCTIKHSGNIGKLRLLLHTKTCPIILFDLYWNLFDVKRIESLDSTQFFYSLTLRRIGWLHMSSFVFQLVNLFRVSWKSSTVDIHPVGQLSTSLLEQ